MSQRSLNNEDKAIDSSNQLYMIFGLSISFSPSIFEYSYIGLHKIFFKIFKHHKNDHLNKVEMNEVVKMTKNLGLFPDIINYNGIKRMWIKSKRKLEAREKLIYLDYQEFISYVKMLEIHFQNRYDISCHLKHVLNSYFIAYLRLFITIS